MMYTLKLSPSLQHLTSSSPTTSSSNVRRIMRNRLVSVVAIILLILCFIFVVDSISGGSLSIHLFTFIPNEEFQSKYSAGMQRGQPRYGIIFDAGSTGSRVHVFEFRYNQSNKEQPYALIDELFVQVKPGLSAYSEDPLKAAHSLANLTEACKRRIPHHFWHDTPVSLKATAGLRLLSERKARVILDKVHTYLSHQPFHMGHNAVSIMDGLDEGVFSWVTLNFLTGKISRPELSYGALDLGGGSTQITYVPAPKSISPQGYTKNFQLGPSQINLYSHSYLALGLMSARLRILGGNQSMSAPSGLMSPCLPASFVGKWRHAGITYEVRGRSVHGYSPCYTKAVQIVRSSNVHAPSDIKNKSFFAFSYFYDRAADAKIISKDLGGKVSLDSYIKAAKSVCSRFSRRRPYLCLDLCYIIALLKEGYKFDSSTEFVMRKKIHSVELSWALGAVFDIFYNSQPRT